MFTRGGKVFYAFSKKPKADSNFFLFIFSSIISISICHLCFFFNHKISLRIVQRRFSIRKSISKKYVRRFNILFFFYLFSFSLNYLIDAQLITKQKKIREEIKYHFRKIFYPITNIFIYFLNPLKRSSTTNGQGGQGELLEQR